MPTISKEDYIKAIYSFGLTEEGAVTTSQIAKKMHVSNAAISDMAKKLAAGGYIEYSKYRGMALTDKGENTALQILRKHRLWELFLNKVLDIPWSEVHDEAEKLEHHTSELLADKLDEYLGYPEFDPHGAPIPQKDGQLPPMPAETELRNCKTGKIYILNRVSDQNSEMIRYISKLGLRLTRKIKLVERLSFDNSIIIEIDGIRHSISEKVSSQLFVSEESK